MTYVVIIRTVDSTISPIAIGPFNSKEQAIRYGEHYDYRLRADQLWSVSLIATPAAFAPNGDSFLDLI